MVLGMGVGVIIIGPLAKLADPTPNALATKAAVNRRFFILNVYTSELCLKGPSTDYFCSSNLFCNYLYFNSRKNRVGFTCFLWKSFFGILPLLKAQQDFCPYDRRYPDIRTLTIYYHGQNRLKLLSAIYFSSLRGVLWPRTYFLSLFARCWDLSPMVRARLAGWSLSCAASFCSLLRALACRW